MSEKKIKQLKKRIERLVDEGKIPPVLKSGFRRVKKAIRANPKLDIEQYVLKLAREDFAKMWARMNPKQKAEFSRKVAEAQTQQKEGVA